MSRSCDVLILTARFGSGHLSAAHAIKESLHIENNGLEVEIVDFIDTFLRPFSPFIYGVDRMSSAYYPALYNSVYYRKQDGADVLTNKINRSFILRRLNKYVAARSPRLIISTFPLSAYYVSLLIEEYAMDIKAITCITDIVVKSEWYHAATDLYLTANEHIKNRMISMGIPHNRIAATGVPVRSAFLCETDADGISLKYHINEDSFVILLMGGGNGYLPGTTSIYRWLNTLDRAKTFVFTANNHRLYHRLTRMNPGDNIHVLNFTGDVAPLMKRADLLISKAGGITIAEAVACNLPMIIYKAELGQELDNRRFIIDNRLGLAANTEKELKDQTYQLMSDKSLYQEIKSDLLQYRGQTKPESVGKRILELLSTGEGVGKP